MTLCAFIRLPARFKPALLGAAMAFGMLAAHSQNAPADDWRLSLGYQHYSEPAMRLQGPEMGLHWRRPVGIGMQLEAEALVGIQNYNSDSTGSLNEVLNVDTRWRVMQPLGALPAFSYGLALHTHYNNLRGTTSTDNGGYERISAQIWLPVRWSISSAQPWEIDAGALLWGRHTSRLSQAGPGNSDVTNVQRTGFYLQGSTTLASSYGPITPYVRWAWVDNSDEKVTQFTGLRQRVYEPRNNRVDVGLQWRFR